MKLFPTDQHRFPPSPLPCMGEGGRRPGEGKVGEKNGAKKEKDLIPLTFSGDSPYFSENGIVSGNRSPEFQLQRVGQSETTQFQQGGIICSAVCAGIFIYRRKAIRKTASHREHGTRISPTTGCARYAVSIKIILPKTSAEPDTNKIWAQFQGYNNTLTCALFYDRNPTLLNKKGTV